MVLVSAVVLAAPSPTCKLIDVDESLWACPTDILPPMRAAIARLQADCTLGDNIESWLRAVHTTMPHITTKVDCVRGDSTQMVRYRNFVHIYMIIVHRT